MDNEENNEQAGQAGDNASSILGNSGKRAGNTESPDNAGSSANGSEQSDSHNTSSVYDNIIAQKDAQIEALLNQTSKLTEQITSFINSGAQLNDGGGSDNDGKEDLSLENIVNDDSMSLEALGREIGKPRKD